MNAAAATEDNIQDQDLVNDQITAAIDKLSETASAAVATEPAATSDTPLTADPLSDTTADQHGATHTSEPTHLPVQESLQGVPSILDEHQEASSDSGSLGSINLGSVPVETADHSQETTPEANHNSHDLPAPVISGSDITEDLPCLLYTSPSPRDATLSRMPSSA